MKTEKEIKERIVLFKQLLDDAKRYNDIFTVDSLQARINSLNWVLGIYEQEEQKELV